MRLTAAMIAATAVLLAQQTAEPPAFRSATRLVQVNVVVHDRSGRPVEDLKPEDFTIEQDGSAVKIAFFSLQRSGTTVTPEAPLPQNIFSNRFGDKAGVPQSVTVLLLDKLNTRTADGHIAQRQVMKALSQIQPGERVAIYLLDRTLRILQDFTSDIGGVSARLEQYWNDRATPAARTGRSTRDDRAAFGGILVPDLPEDLGAPVRGSINQQPDQINVNRVLRTLSTLRLISEHLAAVPGRKSLIWVTGGIPFTMGFEQIRQPVNGQSLREQEQGPRGFPETRTFFLEWQKTVRALNHAAVAVYPVDARGLMTDPSTDVTSTGNLGLWSPTNVDSMREVAQRTGGRAFYNTNDILSSVRQAFDDTAVTYTLAFYAPWDENRKPGWRRIGVKVNRPDVNVRHRSGYLTFDNLDAADVDSVKADLRAALLSPLDATSVSLNVRVDKLKADPKTLRVVAQIAPETVTLDERGDRVRAQLDTAWVQMDDKGQELRSVSERIDINVTRAAFRAATGNGLVGTRNLQLHGRATTLRVVVRDASTGLMGSVSVPLSQVAAL